MKNRKSIAALILCTSLLFACNKDEHWETTVVEISGITSYSADFTINYDFGGKPSNTFVGVAFGTDPEMKVNTEIYLKEQQENELYTYTHQHLFANQTYYLQGFMVGRKDTVWSAIKSFTTLNEPELSCSVLAGEIYYSGNGTTESVGTLVEVENTEEPELFNYEVSADIGNLLLTFIYEPLPGLYTTGDAVYNTYEHSLPIVRVKAWFNSGTEICQYQANDNGRVHISKDTEGNTAISFCDLAIDKIDGGACVETQVISGRIVN